MLTKTRTATKLSWWRDSTYSATPPGMSSTFVTSLKVGLPTPTDPKSGLAVRGAVPASSQSFADALSKLQGPDSVVTVKPGDTLSGLIHKHLQAGGSPVQASASELYRLSVEVAAKNGIPDPNLIYPDQKIDLAGVSDALLTKALQPQVGAPGASWAQASGPWRPEAKPASGPRGGPGDFLIRHGDAARKVEGATGIPASFMMGQAALETAWGQREIRFPNGQTSHNLFGIQAGPQWKGPVVEVWTTEYIQGQAQRVKGVFRAYDSYEASFQDYARLISQTPRYAQAMRHLNDPQAFAQALQHAGYATAPHYAQSLTSVIESAQRWQTRLSEGLAQVAAGALTAAQALQSRTRMAAPDTARTQVAQSSGAPLP